MMRLTVLLLTLSCAASFQTVVRDAGTQTRNRRGMSTMFYANAQDDGSVLPRWLQSSLATQSSKAEERRGADEEAVDEYLEFLAKRYR